MRELTLALQSGRALPHQIVREIAASFALGNFDPAEAAEFLIAFQQFGYRAEDLYAFADAFRSFSLTPSDAPECATDTCGTGGGLPSWNLSTAAALIACGAGAVVAKHGNRAVTSKVGSADVLEALGVRIDAEPQESWRRVGIAFLFAPHYHPAFRHIGPVRRSVPTRTIFNYLGPLLNPARVRRQVLGVFEKSMIHPMAEALAMLGVERALVVSGADGLDEVSPLAETHAVFVEDGDRREITVRPAEFGIEDSSMVNLQPGDTAEENADRVRTAIQDASSGEFHAVLPSAATAIWVAGLAGDIASATDLARKTVQTGRAAQVLAAWSEVSQR